MNLSAPPSEPAAMRAPARGAPSPGDDGATERLSAAYGGVFRRLLNRAFAPVQVPAQAAARLAAHAQEGTVVYVARSAAFVTFLFFQHLALRLGAPLPKAVVGLGAKLWRPWGRLVAGRPFARAPRGDDAAKAVRLGESALVFLRRPGSLAASGRALKDPFPALVAAQRAQERPILLVPELLIWERRPRNVRRSLFDVLFGEPEAPGLWRSLFSFLWNRKRAFVQLDEPLNLKTYLEEHAGEGDRAIARKVRGALYQHLARQTRVVTGPPLKSPERLIEETLRDRALRATVAEVARARGRADGSVDLEAERDLKEIAARYSPRAIDWMKWLLDFVFDRIYDGIEVHDSGLEEVRRTLSTMPILVCPSHKSHIDYLVMSYVFYLRGLIPPHIAAGINLSFWPLGRVFRASGAYFIRRSFKGDTIYAAVLKAYVRKLSKDGFSQEFFIEGGRSRTGKVLLPRFGMLAMHVDAWIDGVRPDVAFVPSWIGYAHIIEGRSYAAELGGDEKKPEDLGALLKTPKVLTSRYGRVFIRFDAPISLAGLARERGFDRTRHTEEERRSLVRALGFRIVDGINRATAVSPSALLATALLAHDRRGLTAPELVDRMEFLLQQAVANGGRPTFTKEPGALDPLGSGPLREARLALERDGQLVQVSAGGETIFQVPEEARIGLDYLKNTTLCFFVPEALLATAVLTSPSHERQAIEARTLELSRLFKKEFVYPSGAFERLFDERVRRFLELGLVEASGSALESTAAGAERLRLFADVIVHFVEGYVMVAEALSLLLSGPVDSKDLVRRTMERARAAYLAGRLRRSESRSKVLVENALALFEAQGLVVRAGEKGRQRALAPAMGSQAAVEAHAAEIRTFLVNAAA